MKLYSLPCHLLVVITILLHFPPLVFPSPLAARAQTCDNAPLTVAGTLLNRHTDRSLLPRTRCCSSKYFLWCVPSTTTYVTITLTGAVAATALNALLENAHFTAYTHSITVGDALVTGGRFTYTVDGFLFKAWNANNHQMTWRVLQNALWGIRDFINGMDEKNMMTFSIYDGINMVGKGTISMVGNGS